EPVGRGPAWAARQAYRTMIAARLRRCASVITPSRSSADEAIATLGLDAHRVAVVPHGVTSIFTATPSSADAGVRRSCGLGQRPFLLWTGSLRHHDVRKRLDLLLDALGRLSATAPILALVGAGGVEAQ